MEDTGQIMAQVKLVIFDCDGVMFDSRDANEAYYNHILIHFGKSPMNREEADYVHMHTADQSVAYLFRDDRQAEQALAYRHHISYHPFIPAMRMEPYLKAFLEYLRPRHKTAISTNRSDTMHRVLVDHGLEGYFDMVVSSLDVERPKPDPESLLKILDHFGLSPHEAIYIGDSQIDELAAKAAGIPLVAYKNSRLSAAFKVAHFKEIETLLEKRG
ncbi:MAG: HAD-IA family hydrolase [Thermodesulfobacteriota bacterium]|nr:HAD-IA family hydrolase [Thermodesulfobacteriota bacterium]